MKRSRVSGVCADSGRSGVQARWDGALSVSSVCEGDLAEIRRLGRVTTLPRD
jgi:hypothetical protein